MPSDVYRDWPVVAGVTAFRMSTTKIPRSMSANREQGMDPCYRGVTREGVMNSASPTTTSPRPRGFPSVTILVQPRCRKRPSQNHLIQIHGYPMRTLVFSIDNV